MNKFLNLWKGYSFILLIAFIIIGLVDSRFAVAAIICMIAPIIVAIFKGRFWCGNLCPRGNFYDNVVAKFSNKKRVPRILKSKYFRVIMVIFLFSIFTIGLRENWGDFNGVGLVFYRIIAITTLVGIILSFFFNHRTWCHFCPMGSIASFIARFRKSEAVLQVSDMCVSCKMCEKNCPLGIIACDFKGDFLSNPDCIQCGKCVKICPKKAIGYEKNK